RRVSPEGNITTFAGNGTAGYSGDGGKATDAQLNAPSAVVIDPIGNLFIADSNNRRVRMVSPDGTITTIAGVGSKGYSGDGGLATSAEMGQLSGLAMDEAGNLYVSDQYNNVVRILRPVRNQ